MEFREVKNNTRWFTTQNQNKLLLEYRPAQHVYIGSQNAIFIIVTEGIWVTNRSDVDAKHATTSATARVSQQ